MAINKKYVAIVGNLSDGFKCFGPYDTFEDAAVATEGLVHQSWITTLYEPQLTKENDDGI